LTGLRAGRERLLLQRTGIRHALTGRLVDRQRAAAPDSRGHPTPEPQSEHGSDRNSSFWGRVSDDIDITVGGSLCYSSTRVREPICSKSEIAMIDDQRTIRKRMDDLSAQRAIAARVLDWLESDRSFEEVHGSESRKRHATAERERIARLDEKIALCERSLRGGQLVNPTELAALRKRVASL